MFDIKEAVRNLLETIPPHVILVAAAKGRSLDEVVQAIEAGITHVGHNYVQDALPMVEALGHEGMWHMIGHLQRNKVKKAIHTFDLIETVDSLRLAKAINRHCANAGKIMPVLVEINSGGETSKTGVLPEDVDDLVISMAKLDHIRLLGLMTMGPRFGDPDRARPYFSATREAFIRISAMNLPNVTMRYLSMGMSNSYKVAIEEGANVVRIGTKIFGPHI
ncbi:MAG: YggS family pyridoxal phosphate-dependent enzyme [Anaerolineales bacterium]|nr:YggS family pyridoxal phosphate-dependent enzyme [Anaerolineales bacterium]